MIYDLKIPKKYWNHISGKRKFQFYLTLIVMIISSLAEMLSIGVTIPFLIALTSPEKIFNHELAQSMIHALSITQPEQLLLPVAMIFCIVIIFSVVIRIVLVYTIVRYSYSLGADLSFDVYRRTLYQNYSVHLSQNSSEIINVVVGKMELTINGLLIPIMTIISSLFIFFGIIIILFVADPIVASSAALGFSFVYGLILISAKRHIVANGEIIAKNSTALVKTLQEGLGGVRDVILDNSQDFHCKIFRKLDLSFRWAKGSNSIIAQSPKHIVEALGMVLIVILAYFMSKNNQHESIVPVLGALAIGAQRLLPVMQNFYSALIAIKSSESSTLDVLRLLDQKISLDSKNISESITFQKEINIDNISFSYAESETSVLSNINFNIKKGSCIGIVGKTGSGKSTLVDIIMGLLQPTSGRIVVDGVAIEPSLLPSWRSNIAHVPQSIFLFDASIAENIAIGVEQKNIDYILLDKVLKQSQLYEVVESLPDKYETRIGERGIRLSGGQRQRIGIARALYKQTEILIFDESTSALDNDTEKQIMQVINKLGAKLTILIIAHRVTTLRNCDQIVEVSNKGVNVLNFKDLYPS